MDIPDRMWPWLNRAFKLHTGMYRLTRGAVGHKFPGAPPMLLLDHVGAKTGIKRTTPLAYVPDGDDVVLVASKGGHPTNPAWYHNLVANPDTTVQIGSEHRQVHAHVATAEERKRLWPVAVAVNKGYANYQEKTSREIPLVILKRRP
ncbi:MAG: nitroreductase family deazaflavin-dependent oxidoreductase [Actinomycetota bacterium]